MMWQRQAARDAAVRAAQAKQRQTANMQAAAEFMQSPAGVTWNFSAPSHEWAFPISTDGNQALLTLSRRSPDESTPASFSKKDIFCLDLETGKASWSRVERAQIITPPTFAGDLVVYGAEGYQLVALDRTNGIERFRVELDRLREFAFGSEIDPIQFPLLVEGKIYVATHGKATSGDASGKLYAVDLKTGKKLWGLEMESGATMSPILHEDLLIVGCGKWVYGVKAADGSLAWRTPIGNRGVIQLGLMAQGRIYVQTGFNDLHALEGRTGTGVWTIHLPPDSFVQGEGNRLYYVHVRSLDIGWAVGLDANDGKQVWTTKLGFGGGGFWMGRWTQDGIAFLSRKDDLVGLDLANGKINWRITIPETVKGVPIPVGGHLLVAAKSWGKTILHAIKQSDGTDAWSYKLNESLGGSSIALGHKGILVPIRLGKATFIQ